MSVTPVYFSVLNMEGANNGTVFTDAVSPAGGIYTANGSAITSTAQSKWGNGSGYFNGTTSYLLAGSPSIFNLSEFNYAMQCWVYPTSLPSSLIIFASLWSTNGASSVDQWLFGYNHSLNLILNDFRAADGSTYVGNRFTATLSLNTWQHIAVCKLGTKYYGFLNGSYLGTNTITTTMNAYNSSASARIGNLTTLFYPGYMQDFTISRYNYYAEAVNFTPPGRIEPAPIEPYKPTILTPYFDGGRYRIIGTVTELGLAGRYRVRLFDRYTGRHIAQTWSDAASGAYTFSGIAYRANGYFVVAYDHGDTPLNAAIADLVTPEPIP